MFTVDSRSEKFLESIGVKFDYTNDMAFGELAPKWDTENLGRSKARVKGAIQEYGALMDKGSAAPAPILWKHPTNGKHAVLDGVQRLLAEELRNPRTFSAYVVKTDSEAMVKKIRVFANYRLQGGYQESSEWTLERAVELLINTGIMSVEEVAEVGGWTRAAVRDKKQVMDCRYSIRNVGGPSFMPDAFVRLVVKNSQPNDFQSAPAPIAGFMNDIKKMKLSAAEAEPYVSEFFSISRDRGKPYSQLEKGLEKFRNNKEIKERLADPFRRKYQTTTADGRIIKSLKMSLTTVERVRDQQESVECIAECFHLLNQIRSCIQQIQRLNKGKK